MFVKKTMDELNRLSNQEMQQADKHDIIVILDNIRSMHNVGSAFRTSDAFLINALYLCGFTPQPPHRDIHKTALGATDTVTWKHFETTNDAVQEAKNVGYSIISIEQTHNSIPLNEYKWDKKQKLALVFGNEVQGVNDDILNISDTCLEIPQWGSKHSLNISVSLGVTLWELVRS